jgi:hypothetical protein
MRKAMLVTILLMLIGSYSFAQTGLKAFLPKNDELAGWTINSDVSEYKGNDLIFFVNREADLYHEFGFAELMTTSFSNDQNEAFSIEVYRMKDIYASYGIYLYKSEGMEDKYEEAGKDAFIDDNSLVMWKHHYIAVIKGDYRNSHVSTGMELMADLVDSRIKIPGRWPAISHTFRNSPGNIVLLRGKIGLQNVYYFTSKDVFRIEEGYAIQKPGITDIHLKYSDSFTTIQRFGEVAGVLSREKRFRGFAMVGNTTFKMIDENGSDISIEAESNYLNIRIQNNIITTGREEN